MAIRQERRSRFLRVVLTLDALGSAAMPALLLAAVPLLIILDAPAGLVGAVILGFAVALGAMGATIAWILGKAVVRGDVELSDTGWFLPLTASGSAPRSEP